jgi:hypothetical protein
VVAGAYTLLAEEIDSLGGVWDGEPATVYVLTAPKPQARNPRRCSPR